MKWGKYREESGERLEYGASVLWDCGGAFNHWLFSTQQKLTTYWLLQAHPNSENLGLLLFFD